MSNSEFGDGGSVIQKTAGSKTSKASQGKKISLSAKKTKSIQHFDDSNIKAKTPEKTLEGHKRALREIAYSVNYKILISVGYDFQVFVWNPYWEKEIISF